MAVGDAFKKRRNLVQKAPLPSGSPQYSYRPQYGGWMQDNPVFNEPPNLRGMSESQMAGPLQEYLAQTGFLPNMVYRQNPMTAKALPQPQNGGRVNAFKVEPVGVPPAGLRVNTVDVPSVPRAPTYSVVNPDVESARRLAPMLAQDAARQQNTPINGMTAYEANPMRLRPDQKLSLAERSAAQYMQGGAAADPTNVGARFAGAAGRINSEYDKVKAGHGVFVNGQFMDFTPTGNPQWGTEENMRRRTELGNAPRQATPEQRQSAQARRAGIQREFIDRTGMNYAQARRAERKDELRQRSYNKAIIRGMNPFGPEAQAMFPQQVAAAKAGATGQQVVGQNPMAAGGRTLEEQQAAAARIQERETTNPVVAGLGVQPGSGLAGVNEAFRNRLAEDPNAEFSDESLREYQAHAKDYKGVATDTNNPFKFGTSIADNYQSELWKELADLPDNARARAEWLQRYKSRTAEAKAAAEKPSTPVYGNPYGYAAPFTNTFNRGIKPVEMYKNPMK